MRDAAPVTAGGIDARLTDYTDDMVFAFPGQTDVTSGISAFGTAVANLGASAPTGFEVVAIRHIETNGEVVAICDWKSHKIEASQLAALFRFRGDKIFEERWFVDTEPWKGAC